MLLVPVYTSNLVFNYTKHQSYIMFDEPNQE